MTDRLDLARWDGRIERLESAVASMGAVTAWAHLRTCYRYGACSVEDLQRYVAGSRWQRALPALAERCSRTFAGAVVGLQQGVRRGRHHTPIVTPSSIGHHLQS